MKQHGTNSDALTATEVPVLEPGAMARTVKAGAARADRMTENISAYLRAAGREICADDQALEWFYGGGPLSQSTSTVPPGGTRQGPQLARLIAWMI